MDQKIHINILVQLAKVDGCIDKRELDLIRKIANLKNVSNESIDKLIKDPVPIIDLEYLSKSEKFEIIYSLILLMKADGQVCKSEIIFCEDMAERLGYNRKLVASLSSKIYSSFSVNTDRDSLKKISEEYIR